MSNSKRKAPVEAGALKRRRSVYGRLENQKLARKKDGDQYKSLTPQDRIANNKERTLREFQEAPAVGEGQRHSGAKDWAYKLHVYAHQDIYEIEQMLIGKYGLPESEVRGLVKYYTNKYDQYHPVDDGYSLRRSRSWAKPRTIESEVKPPPLDIAGHFSDSVSVGEPDFFEKSGIKLEDPKNDPALIIAYCFEPGDLVAIKPGKKKTPSIVKSREDWLTDFEDNPVPQATDIPKSEQGAWIYINPVTENILNLAPGFRHVSAEYIAKHRYCLVESDDAGLQLQLNMAGYLLSYLQAVIFSGGKSYHCWVRVDAENEKEYNDVAQQLKKLICKDISRFGKFGYDKTFYSSAHSRMCGAVNGKTGNDQRLVFLTNVPSADPLWRKEKA